MSTALAWALVAPAGAAGAAARYLVDRWARRRSGSGLPLGTLLVNLTGAFLLGLVVGAGVGGEGVLVVGTGLLGSYTTFSTWMFESHRLAEEGAGGAALANLAVSIAAGLAVAGAGWAIGAALA